MKKITPLVLMLIMFALALPTYAAQHDMNIANATAAAVRTDINSALTALVSNNSGASEPATKYAYQFWADTTTGLLKQRNAANSAWTTIAPIGQPLAPIDNPTFTTKVTTPALAAGYLTTSGNVTVGFPSDLGMRFSVIGSSTAAYTGAETYTDPVAITVKNNQTSANNAAAHLVFSVSGTGVAAESRISGVKTGSGSGALTFATTSAGTLSEKARIAPSGNLLVGTPTDNSVDKLQVNGSGFFTGKVTAGTLQVDSTVTLPGGGTIVSTGGENPMTRIPDLMVDSLSVTTLLDALSLRISANAPTSASDTCLGKEIRADSNYIYVCVGVNTWKRTGIATW